MEYINFAFQQGLCIYPSVTVTENVFQNFFSSVESEWFGHDRYRETDECRLGSARGSTDAEFKHVDECFLSLKSNFCSSTLSEGAQASPQQSP